MGRLVLFVFVACLMPGLAAAQGRQSRELFAGYQQVAGVERAVHGAVAGLVFHNSTRTSGIVTVSGLYESRDATVTFANSLLRIEGGQTAVHVGGGGRWHKPDGRVLFFAQALALLAFTRTATTVTTDSPLGLAVEQHRRSSIDPLIQGGIGATIRAFRRVGISGSVELYIPVRSPHLESVHYRGSLGISVALGGG